MAKTGKTGFGISPSDDAAMGHVAEPAAPPRPRADQRPTCPTHNVQMVAYHSSAMFTNYRCPEKGCRQREKRVRPIGPLKDLYGNGKSARALLNPDPKASV